MKVRVPMATLAPDTEARNPPPMVIVSELLFVLFLRKKKNLYQHPILT